MCRGQLDAEGCRGEVSLLPLTQSPLVNQKFFVYFRIMIGQSPNVKGRGCREGR